jgi:hypothetical protein
MFPDVRKAVQDFKKRNPNFQKLKGCNGPNFGVSLDKAEINGKQAVAIAKDLIEKHLEARHVAEEIKALEAKLFVACEQTHEGVVGVVTVLEADSKLAASFKDPKMVSDFTATLGPVIQKLQHHPVGRDLYKQMTAGAHSQG